jgi:hypothetical protein
MSAAGVTVAQALEAVRARRAVLAPETTGYLVLAIADLLAKSPRLVDAQQCGVLVDGGNVVLKPTKGSATGVEAETSLLGLFRTMLAASSGTAPALQAVAAREASGDLPALMAEIESALVPLNRAAARRALSRLARETLRPATAPRVASDAPPPNEDESAVPMQLSRASWQAAPRQSVRPRVPLEQKEPKRPPALPIIEDDLVSVIQAAKTAKAESRASVRLPEPTPAGSTATDSVTQVDDVTEVEDVSARPQSSASPPIVVMDPTPLPNSEEAAVALPPVAEPSPKPAPAVDVQEQRLAETKPERMGVRTAVESPTPAPARTPVPRPVSKAPPRPSPAAPQTPPAPEIHEASADSAKPADAAATPDPTAEQKKDSLARTLAALSGRPSGPPVKGADELLESFVTSTSRRDHDVAADLKRMVGVEPTPPPPKVQQTAAERRSETHKDRAPPSNDEAPGAELLGSTPPPGQTLAQASPAGPRSSRAPHLLFALLVAAAAGGAGLWWLNDFAGIAPAAPPEPVLTPVPPPRRQAALAEPCRAAIVVSDLAPGTELFVKAGVAPLDVQRVPTGAKVELLALAAGAAPVRGVVASSAAWRVENGKPRHDLTFDLQKQKADGGAGSWPDGGQVLSDAAAGQAGTVHVVTVPPGAEIWMLVGRGPDARVQGLPCGTSVDLLVAGSSDAGRPHRGRLRVDASRFTPDPSGTTRTARASARLAVME